MFYFFYLIFFLALVEAFNVTPTQLSFLKGVRRMRKLGKKTLDLSDDHSSNSMWLLAIGSMIALAYLLMSRYFEIRHLNHVFFLSVLLSQVVFFASIYEYFKLSAYHQKKVVFWTGIAILWFIIPIFGMVTNPLVTSPWYQQYFFSASPFFVTVILFEMIEDRVFLMVFPIALNIALALCAGILALYQRRQLKDAEQ